MEGEVIYFYIYDVGAEIDIEKLERILKRGVHLELSITKAVPEYVKFPSPINIELKSEEFETSVGKKKFDVCVRIFSIGAVSISVRASFTVNEITELLVYNRLELSDGKGKIGMMEYTKRIFDEIMEEIKHAFEESYDVKVPPEKYTVFVIKKLEKTPKEIFLNKKKELCSLLMNEPNMERLSDKEMDDTLRCWYSYYLEDLVIIDWDRALIFESGNYDELLFMIEIANMQLLELRTYDAYIDKVLDKCYDDFTKFFSKKGIFTSARPMVKILSDVRVDMAKVTDEITNITKFFGDWYLAKAYLGCAEKFHLKDWQTMVNEKLQTLNELYLIANEEVGHRRTFILEAMIVLLFLIDLVLIGFVSFR
ncbi:MAG: hypothetical protein AB1779_05520 [Candidatus Thermoplasmatota archaeon]